jgi:hypothetical protein
VTVQYATTGGTATAGGDYTATSGTLTIPAGSTSSTIAVPILGDATIEPDETFMVNLSVPTNATIGTGTGTGTILNDDPAASASFGGTNFAVVVGDVPGTPSSSPPSASAARATTARDATPPARSPAAVATPAGRGRAAVPAFPASATARPLASLLSTHDAALGDLEESVEIGLAERIDRLAREQLQHRHS